MATARSTVVEAGVNAGMGATVPDICEVGRRTKGQIPTAAGYRTVTLRRTRASPLRNRRRGLSAAFHR